MIINDRIKQMYLLKIHDKREERRKRAWSGGQVVVCVVVDGRRGSEGKCLGSRGSEEVRMRRWRGSSRKGPGRE